MPNFQTPLSDEEGIIAFALRRDHKLDDRQIGRALNKASVSVATFFRLYHPTRELVVPAHMTPKYLNETAASLATAIRAEEAEPKHKLPEPRAPKPLSPNLSRAHAQAADAPIYSDAWIANWSREEKGLGHV